MHLFTNMCSLILYCNFTAGNVKSKRKAEKRTKKQNESKTGDKTTKIIQDKTEKESEIPYLLVMKHYHKS